MACIPPGSHSHCNQDLTATCLSVPSVSGRPHHAISISKQVHFVVFTHFLYIIIIIIINISRDSLHFVQNFVENYCLTEPKVSRPLSFLKNLLLFLTRRILSPIEFLLVLIIYLIDIKLVVSPTSDVQLFLVTL